MKTFQDLQNIELGTDKVAKFVSFAFADETKVMDITIDVKFSGNDSILNKWHRFSFNASTEKMVNEYGLIDGNGTISEYDFFIAYVSTNQIEFFTIIYDKIIEAYERNLLN